MIFLIYVPLSKIYYKDAASHKAIYRDRLYNAASFRFDFFIKQFNRRTEFPAFFLFNEELQNLIDCIYSLHSRLRLLLDDVPHMVLQQFARFGIIEEIQSTNDIEGVQSTRRELRDVLENSSHSPRFKSIINSYNRLVYGDIIDFQTVADIRDFYERFTYDEVLAASSSNRLDGVAFRAASVDITTSAGKTVHRGVYPETEIIRFMETALRLLHDRRLPLLVRLAVFHYLFAYIHPFYDGNGRTGRFIVSYFLSRDFHYIVALRLSVIIKRYRKKYYELFKLTDAAINCGDLTPFIIGFNELVALAFSDVIDILSRKLRQLDKLEKRLLPIAPDDALYHRIYILLLQASSFYGYGLTLRELAALLDKSPDTVRRRLRFMPAQHLTVIKSKPYRYKLNANILKNISTT